MKLVYRYRVKGRCGSLNRMARAVNQVWNFCNDTQKHALTFGMKWPTYFTLTNLTAGVGPMLGIPANAAMATCKQYEQSRRQHKRPFLRYRGKRSLGWVPFRGQDVKAMPDGFRFAKRVYRVWMSRELPEGARILDGGSFSQDAKGNWYINVCIEVAEAKARAPIREVGIDLGLKTLATLSDGSTIEAPQFFRRTQERLGKAQRARKKRLARHLHAKVANQRKDFLHKHSARLVRDYDHIVVGNINAAGLARTTMAKSALDAGWSTLRNQLRYKAITHGATYTEVSERFTTQACSACGALGGPKGREGLGIRGWRCEHCGCLHDRDVNSAINILRLGHQPLRGAA